MADLLKRHFDCYRGELPDNGLVVAAKEVQEKLFPYPIWGPGIEEPSARAIDALREAVGKLTPVQATQVVLLNGMHGANIFLALAAVTGIVSFEAYKDFQTSGFAPDSEEEQFVRISTSFIDLFGVIAPPCPGHAGGSRKARTPVTRPPRGKGSKG